jgi:hypothetical protein
MKLWLLLLVGLFISLPARADTYIPIESPIYDYLRKFEAEGVINSAMLGTLPISRKEVARLVSEAMSNESGVASPYMRKLLLYLEKEFADELGGGGQIYLRPLDELSLEYDYSDKIGFFTQKNRNGTTVEKGTTGFAELTARFNSPHLGGVATPQIQWDEDEISVRQARGYLLASMGREEFFIGKENNWWGPGTNGTIILSNNAAPVTMLKMSNSTPYEILGTAVRGTFFISRLEDDRQDVEEPIFYGLRLNLKPSRYLEIGLTKTAMFGGEGRDESFSTFLDSLLGRGENSDSPDDSEPGNQIAGIDLKLVIPWSVQPFTLYGELAGEDEAGGLPSRNAWLAGIYLPRVLDIDRLELWGEYADTDVSGHSGFWYDHHIYTEGYTFKGRIMGHYMGPDATDLFIRARYSRDKDSVAFSYERLNNDYPDPFVWQDYGVELTRRILKQGEMRIHGRYSREDENNLAVGVGFRYVF